MHVRYRVELDESERQQLEALVAGGTRGVRRVKRAQILLAAADGASDEMIAVTVQSGRPPCTGPNGGWSRRVWPPRSMRRFASRGPSDLAARGVPLRPETRELVEYGRNRNWVLVGQCLDRRIPDRRTLAGEVAAWTRRRNDAGAAVKWMFGIEQAARNSGEPTRRPRPPLKRPPRESVRFSETGY